MDELAEKRTPMRVSAQTARRIAATDHSALTHHSDRKAVREVPAKVMAAAEILATTPGAPDYAKIAHTDLARVGMTGRMKDSMVHSSIPSETRRGPDKSTWLHAEKAFLAASCSI